MSTNYEIKEIKIIPMYDPNGNSLPAGYIIEKTIKSV